MWKIVFKVDANVHTNEYCSDEPGDNFNFTVGFLLTDNELKEELKKGENFGIIKIPRCIQTRGTQYCRAEGGTAEMIKLERLPGLEYDGKIIDNLNVVNLFASYTYNWGVLIRVESVYHTIIHLEGLDDD